jgi:hypothetical protein
MTDLRLSPSGPPIKNSNGAPLTFGRGARLRLDETNSTMTGSQAIPTVPDVVCPDGFGQTDAVVLTLPLPKQSLNYRAVCLLDIINTSTNTEGEVELYLDTSIDGGTTYTNRAKNSHLIPPLHPSLTGSSARQAQVNLPMVLGAGLGILDTAPPASLKLRVRAGISQGSTGLVQVNSLATSGGGTPVTGLNGTIHIELEECF